MIVEQDELREAVIRDIVIAAQLLHARLDASLAPWGLSSSRLAVLSHLARHPERSETVSSLAAVMNMQQPGATKVVGLLAERGLLAVGPDPRDARRRLVTITESGRVAFATAVTAAAGDAEVALGGLSGEELTSLVSLLGRVRSALDDARWS